MEIFNLTPPFNERGSMSEIYCLVRKHFGTSDNDEKMRGEICEIRGSCEHPQYLLVDSSGEQFWWCQHLTNQSQISETDKINYWRTRAEHAERKLRAKEGC